MPHTSATTECNKQNKEKQFTLNNLPGVNSLKEQFGYITVVSRSNNKLHCTTIHNYTYLRKTRTLQVLLSRSLIASNKFET